MLKKIVFISALLVMGQAQAAEYGMAGCGLGGMVFKDQPGMIQIVASTLNNLVSPQTSAITSGTSGCVEGSGASAQLNYIETNKTALMEDAARGSGETLSGLSTLLGCESSNVFGSEVKSNYKQIFSQDNSQEILNAIQTNPSIRKSCGSQG